MFGRWNGHQFSERAMKMASLSRAADGRFSVQFVDTNDKRKTLRLGKIDKRTAESTRLRVEALLACRI